MSALALVLVLALALQSGGSAPATPPAAPRSGCRIGLVADLPVSFVRNRPVVPVEIDGRPVRALVDTGAQTSVLFKAAADRLGMRTHPLPELRIQGVDGEISAMTAHVSSFSLVGHASHSFDIVVLPGGSDVDMVIGEDFLSRTDLEFDLGHGKLRLLQTQGCAEDEMAYWAKSYSEAPFTQEPGGSIRLVVKLNGAPIRAEFDSGAQVSVASDDAAGRAKVALGLESGRFYGVSGKGFSRRTGVVAKVAVGDEVVANAPLSFGPLHRAEFVARTGSIIATGANEDMLLGADFLRSHHVLVSRARQKLYFTYDGGPVFRLEPSDPSPNKEPPAP